MMISQLEGLDKREASELLKDFILLELKWNQAARTFNQYDMQYVVDRATQYMQDFSSELLNDPNLGSRRIQALAFFQASIELMNQKQLLTAPMEFEIKKRKK